MQNFKKKLIHNQIKKFTTCKNLICLLIVFSICTIHAGAYITDDFAEATLDKNLKIKPYAPILIEEVLPSSNGIIKKHQKVISEKEKSPLNIRIENKFTTKRKPEEGSYINFVTVLDCRIGNKIYPAGTNVVGRIENISYNSNWGTPTEIVIGNFKISDIPLDGEINKTGANRTLWLRPLSIAVSAFGGMGVFLIFVKGGHVKIQPEEIFTVYY